MVMEAVQEDSGDGSMTCTDHPYKNRTPGGICAFCLQEKLGKLVTSSSSFPIAVFPTNSSPSSPSFRTDTTTTASSALTIRTIPSKKIKKSRLPFLLPHKNKKKLDTNKIVFSRSKSTVTPRRPNFDDDLTTTTTTTTTHNKRKLFSFLYLPKLKSSTKLADVREEIAVVVDNDSNIREVVEEEEGDISPAQVSFDRKVSRSRSVGCGSRSFSGDFFERISTGFGDCTLRRVESQREGKARARHGGGGGGGGRGKELMKERVKCGGLFSGFMITSSSSSSSSSSNWVPENNGNGKAGAVMAHARSRSWGWAFSSPMRAFSKNSNAKRTVVVAGGIKSNVGGGAPNLPAIPSILAVRS